MKHETLSPWNISPWNRISAGLLLAITAASPLTRADEKPEAVKSSVGESPSGQGGQGSALFQKPAPSGKGTRTTVSSGAVQYPLVIVSGTPYEMGRQLGMCISQEMNTFIPAVMESIMKQLGLTPAGLQEIWARSAAFTDDRLEQELAGLADGSGVPLALLQSMHAVPLLMPYSCSSVAAWGSATTDGHLYQTRNLDWSLELKAHEFPVIVVYVPERGIPHVVPTFAGMAGAHTGMNIRGVALSEMGDSSAKEMPYQIHAPHFTSFFRTMLYDADSLTSTLTIFKAQEHTKRYHFVFGDGLTDKRAVKIRAHSPEAPHQRITIWKDNDATDEVAPDVLSCVVYNDEGRGAYPVIKENHGRIDAEKMIALANHIPIKGGNVENVVYDATALKLWVSYAHGDEEAWQRPYVEVNLRTLDANADGKPDLTIP